MYHSQHATQTSVHPAEGWVQVTLIMLRRQLLLPLRTVRNGGCSEQVYHSQHATWTSVHPAEGCVQMTLSM